MTDNEKPTGLALMREPFPESAIGKLPKPTKKQTEAVRNDYKKGIRCKLCKQWHHPDVDHLDYVGHAALTDRLLECDPEWNWEPMAFSEAGLPMIDQMGGMWIKLTVCGQTRLGYGDAAGKSGPSAIKEVIGDALRNAAMRFGAALDLWHKGDLHGPDVDDGDVVSGDIKPAAPPSKPKQESKPERTLEDIKADLLNALRQQEEVAHIDNVWANERFNAEKAKLSEPWQLEIANEYNTLRQKLGGQ